MITKTLYVRYGRFKLLCAITAIVVLLVASVSAVYAQDMRNDWDGDGVPNSIDRCPYKPGPPENGGCPIKEEPPPAPGGDAGSPPVEGEVDPPDPELPAEPVLLLPYMPEDGPCVIATQGTDGVNVRLLPGTAEGFIVIGGLDPQLLYPVLLSFQTSEGSWWALADGGFAAGWVTRQGGNCSMLPAIQTPGDHSLLFGHTLLDPNQPGSLPVLALFGKAGNLKAVWFLGMGDDQSIHFINPGEEVGFNPQPDPPGEEVGFNPQPDPPGFFLMLSDHEQPPPVNDTPNPDEAGIIINWIIGDGSVMPGDPALGLCDGSVMPGDGSVMPGDGSVVPGDGSVMPSRLLPAAPMMGDGSVMPGGVGVFLCDGSVKPTESVMGDGSVQPTPDDGSPTPDDGAGTPSWLLPATVFPGGGGEEVGCQNNLFPGMGELGGPDTSPAQTCLFSNGEALALCQVTSEEALCAYSEF